MIHFKQDPHIRTTDDPGPVVPGTNVRLRWPEPYDDDVQMIRDRVQEEGRGLYVLRAPWSRGKCIVEAYYPDELSKRYAARMMDPVRAEDAAMGRLVVIKFPPYAETMQVGRGRGSFRVLGPKGITRSLVHEIRRNNRNLNSELKRQAPSKYRKSAIRRERAEEEQAVYDEWSSLYEDAWRESVKFAVPEKRKNFSMYQATR